MSDSAVLIRGAAAILTGLVDSPRAAGPDIRIRNGRIQTIGSLAAESGERVIDASGCLVYPGWINTHHHLLQSLMKGVPSGLNAPLREWLDAVPFTFRMRFDDEILRTAALLGLAELMLTGCTTVADFHNLYYPDIAFDSSASIFEAAEALGLRLVLCRGLGTRARPTQAKDARAMQPEPYARAIQDIERIASRWHDSSPAPMRRVVVAPSSFTHSMEPAELRDLAADARRLGLRLHSHLAESADDGVYCRERFGLRPLEFAERCDWTGRDVWFAHLVHVDAEDIRILARTGTGIGHCPGSNARIGNGIAPVLEMRTAGVRIGLGQDGGAASDAGDMLAEAHMAWYLHRTRGDPQALTIEDVIYWGTRGGADILGLDAVGALAPGFAADLAVYRLDDLRFEAFHDVAIAPVATGIRPYLKCLMVGGRVIAENDRILNLDVGDLRRRVRAAIRRLTAG
jgi:8-oxoguanine deaminase